MNFFGKKLNKRNSFNVVLQVVKYINKVQRVEIRCVQNV